MPNSYSTQFSRNKLRQSLLKKRQPNPNADHIINQYLLMLLSHLTPQSIGLYWPIRGEVDIRSSVIKWFTQQSDIRQMALPYAKEKKASLHFLAWQPTYSMTTDVYGIPAPKDTHTIIPDLLLLPCVGFTQAADGLYYRLGYGTGCYDKTLAELNIPCIGIAHEIARTTEFLPEIHDQPMTYVMTETGCYKSH